MLVSHSSVLLGLIAVATMQVSAMPSILLYTKTAGYRHDSIPVAVETITALGNGSLQLPSSVIDDSISAIRWSSYHTEDQTLFHNQSFLSQFDAISFVSTSDVDPPGVGTVLDDQGLRNFASYIQAGGGFIGIHAAAVTLYGAPFYGRLLGAYFDYHPAIQNVSVKPVTTDHPSTSRLPLDGFEIYEEMYQFRSDPRQLPSPANLLMTNATAYQDGGVNALGFRNGTNGPAPHPLAWWREGGLLDEDDSTDPSVRGGGGANIQVSGGPGRSWFTSLGHDNTTWAKDLYKGHVAGGIGWVLQSQTIRSNNGSATIGQSNGTSSVTVPTSAASSAAAGTGSGSNNAESLGVSMWLLAIVSTFVMSGSLLVI
ncbi:class I glutamine amidotransferase-like protein [Testicularia cyperi]|uniref:Class I glutamine amidotransferase-like protein n=1 Tax=Testicularia cyperi TaxID=1882483 RepID=A0A317XR00_9BASI|nr:class I glutamine amidotransferase-like protein [Testicularia cyperi]